MTARISRELAPSLDEKERKSERERERERERKREITTTDDQMRGTIDAAKRIAARCHPGESGMTGSKKIAAIFTARKKQKKIKKNNRKQRKRERQRGTNEGKREEKSFSSESHFQLQFPRRSRFHDFISASHRSGHRLFSESEKFATLE